MSERRKSEEKLRGRVKELKKENEKLASLKDDLRSENKQFRRGLLIIVKAMLMVKDALNKLPELSEVTEENMNELFDLDD